jgi:MFS family permease
MTMLETKLSRKSGWVVVLTAALFFFYEFIQLIMPNAINLQLRQSFNLDASGLGWLVSMYFWGNLVFLFPAGMLLDRYSTKSLIVGSMVLCTIATFIFALTHNSVIAASARFAVGFGGAFCFLSCIRLASRWFPPNKMALVTGIVVTIAMLGGFVAQSPMVLLTSLMGWRNAVLANATLGVVIIFVIFMLVQDRPPNSQAAAAADRIKLQSLGFWQSIKLVLLNRNNWFGGIYTSLLNLPVFLLGGLWGMRYLVQIHKLSEVQSSYVNSMLFVGVIFGSPVFGWCSDHMGRRCRPMIIGAIASLIVMLVLMYTPHLSFAALMTLFFLIGFVTSSQVLSYPAVAELNPLALTSTAMSVASFIIMSSGMIFDPLFGWLLERHWDKAVLQNEPMYSLTDFNSAMMIMPIAFVVSIVIAMLLQETYCESQVK